MITTEEKYCDFLHPTANVPDVGNIIDANLLNQTHVGITSGNYAYTQDQTACGFVTQPGGANLKTGLQKITVKLRNSDANTNTSSEGEFSVYVKMIGTANTGWQLMLGPDTAPSYVGAVIPGTYSINFNAEDYPGFQGIEAIGVSCSQGGGSPASRGFIKIYWYLYEATYDLPIPYNIQKWDDGGQQWVNCRFVAWNPDLLEWSAAPVYRRVSGAWQLVL